MSEFTVFRITVRNAFVRSDLQSASTCGCNWAAMSHTAGGLKRENAVSKYISGYIFSLWFLSPGFQFTPIISDELKCGRNDQQPEKMN